MALKVRGRARAVRFVVAYGQTESTTGDEGKQRYFWTALDGAVKEVPKDTFFVLVDANVGAGCRGEGSRE